MQKLSGHDLIKGHDQPWEHMCKQFPWAMGRGESRIHSFLTSFKGWQQKEKHTYLEATSFQISSEPWSSERISYSIITEFITALPG